MRIIADENIFEPIIDFLKTVDRTTELFKQYFKTIDLSKINKKLTIITPEGIRVRARR